MEAMARPLNQWNHEPSGAPNPGPYPDFQPGSYPDFRPGQDDRRDPRLSAPSDFTYRLPDPRHQPSLRRDSVQSSYGSTPSPLSRSPPGPPAFTDVHRLSSAPRGGSYDFSSISDRSSPGMNGRPGPEPPSYVRQRQPSEASSISQYAPVRTPHAAGPAAGQMGGYFFAKPQTPRPSQSPRQHSSQATSPVEYSLAQSPRQDPRSHMAVHALLNNDVSSPPSSSKGKNRAPAIPSAPSRPPPGQPDDVQYALTLRQQPLAARSCGFGDRDRRVIDPPPIAQLHITTPGLSRAETTARLRMPTNIVHCSIWSEDGADEMSGMPDEYTRQKRLMGNLVASPFVGADEHGEEGCFFCFPDISVRTPGRYRLKFSLISLDQRPGAKSPVRIEVLSGVFTTYSAKEFPGMSESSALAKSLKHQGCNIPTKKGNEGGGGGGGARPGGGRREESDEGSDDDAAPRRKRPKTNQ